ncbi:MAG: glycosyltransferase [Candidatus Omnitrophota bacterium]
MRILILENQPPFPLNCGSRIRIWNFVRSLYREHELSMFYLASNNDDHQKNVQYFKNMWFYPAVSDRLKLEQINKWQRTQNLLKGIPWEIYERYSEGVNRKFLEIISTHNFDIVFTRHIDLAQYFIKNRHKIKSKAIVDLDDIEFIKVSRKISLTKSKNLYDKLRRKYNNWLLRSYYKRLKFFQSVLVCSDKDSHYLRKERLLKNISVIPNSVNISTYDNIVDFNKATYSKKIILFCGLLSYGPNVDAVRWFVKDVLPLIKQKEPQVKFHIVGMAPKEEVLKLADDKSVFLFPSVPDVAPYYENSSLVVVPLRIAGGTRIKILEALACRRPVVSTSIGAEGLGITSGVHGILADDVNSFAKSCVNLMNNFELGLRLSQEGYKYIQSRYDIKIVEKLIEEVFQDVTS